MLLLAHHSLVAKCVGRRPEAKALVDRSPTTKTSDWDMACHLSGGEGAC